jgi:hypothetical protein
LWTAWDDTTNDTGGETHDGQEGSVEQHSERIEDRKSGACVNVDGEKPGEERGLYRLARSENIANELRQ